MKFWTRLAVLFYVTTVIFLGTFFLVMATNLADLNGVLNFFYLFYTMPELRVIFGIIAGGLLLLNFLFAQVISDKHQREKTIAFDNPSGRVSVSLNALEDLVRRLIAKESEVKEVKVGIVASKKGLNVNARLILKVDGNIPEMTSNLQDMVKKKIQTTIGITEDVVVKIDVIKIIPEEKKPPKEKTKTKSKKEEELEANIPFQGYRP